MGGMLGKIIKEKNKKKLFDRSFSGPTLAPRRRATLMRGVYRWRTQLWLGEAQGWGHKVKRYITVRDFARMSSYFRASLQSHRGKAVLTFCWFPWIEVLVSGWRAESWEWKGAWQEEDISEVGQFGWLAFTDGYYWAVVDCCSRSDRRVWKQDEDLRAR